MFQQRKRKFKPVVVILSILALIAVSMLTVTLSAYVKQINLFGSGWVGPKYFAFNVDSGGETQSLAPSESVNYDFNVRNFDENGVAQVDLNVSIEIDYPRQLAETGVIEAKLYHDGVLIASDAGSGTLAVMGSVLPAGTETTDVYTLKLTWLDSDTEYLGENKDTKFDPSSISIRVSGYQ